jgi:cyclohexanone monooxygenase
MPRDEERNIKADYKAFRDRVYQYPGAVNQPENAKSLSEATPQEIEEELEKSWLKGGIGYLFTFSDLMESVEKNEVISEFAKKKMTEVIDDPKVLTKLMPDYPIGCKRIVLDNHYFQTYNRDDVTLVDIKDHPIDKITERGLVTDGTEYEVDYIVFATGYDAMTGALTSIDIRGTKGISIKDKWKDNPIAFLGMTVSSFPNMFAVCGPGSPSVLANVITHIEQNSDWITDCMIYLRDSNQSRIEVNPESEKKWAMEVGELGEQSLFAHCNSWYVGANIPGKARVFLAYTGGFPAYTERCDEIANSQYQGFSIS